MKRTPRPWQALALALLLGLGGLIAVTLWLGEPGDLRQLLHLPLQALLGALLLLLASFLAGGARLAVQLRLAGARVNLWRATRSYVLGLFAAAVTPGGGGNGIAIGYSLQRDGVGADVAWSAAVYSAVLDLFFYAWAIPLAAIHLYRAGLITPRLFWFALAMAAICFALWYGLAFHLRVLRHVLVPVVSLPLLKRWRRDVLRLFDDVGSATGTMARGHPLKQLTLHLLSLLLHGATYGIFHLFSAALGSPLDLLSTLSLLVLISAASNVVPTPGASGYFEVALTYAFSQRGAPPGVTAAVVAFRAVTYYVPIVLGGALGGAVLIRELGRDRSFEGEARRSQQA